MWGVRLRHERHAEVPSPVATMPCIAEYTLWKETNHNVQPVDKFIYIIMYIVKVIVAENRDHKFPACGYLGESELARRGHLRPGIAARGIDYGKSKQFQGEGEW